MPKITKANMPPTITPSKEVIAAWKKQQAETHKFYMKHFGQLVGKKVVGVTFDDESYKPNVAYGLRFDDDTSCLVLCDEEGNGPGHLDIYKPGDVKLENYSGHNLNKVKS